MESSTKETQTALANVNTILLAITLGLLSFLGYTTYNTSVAVAGIQTALMASEKKSVDNDRELLDLRMRITAVEISLAGLKRI